MSQFNNRKEDKNMIKRKIDRNYGHKPVAL